MKRILGVLLVAWLVCAGVGCTPVSPWQKEKLALGHMSFEPDPLEAKFRQHVYASKEGSTGGYGVAGGGCGCN